MAEEKNPQEKKIIIDDDWKKEAQKEKETLAAQEEKGKQTQRSPLPQGDFAALISMLVTQAFFAMGALKFEGQENREPDMELAKYNIDMLETLQEKTKGNLTPQEETVLKNTLVQVRMAFVKVVG
jgi:hypothetical protein